MTEVESRRTTVRVEALVDPSFLSAIRWTFGAGVTVDGETAPGRSENRVAVTVDAIGEAAFAGQIAGFGNRVELVEAPEGVFRELTRVAAELYEQYGPGAV